MQQKSNVTILHLDVIQEHDQTQSFIELDSHVDTSCIGSKCHIISCTDKVCSVLPYHQTYKALENIPIVQAGAAYDDQDTCKTYIFILNQSL